MYIINWDKFKVKNSNYTDAFELLCYHIFCRKFGITEGAIADFNQVGLETEPYQYSDGKYYGFQSKFFEKMNYANLKQSITKALNHFTNKDPKKNRLDHIIIFLSCNMKASSKSAQEIVEECNKKGVTVQWFLPSNFDIVLNQPNNIDLVQLFFGEADHLGYIQDSKSMRLNTLLMSREYIELNLFGEEQKISITDYSNLALRNNGKINLISGPPGSGKSVCMSKLFQIYTGSDKNSKSDQIAVLDKIAATSIYVNLNTTSLESLEGIVRNRKNEYGFAGQNNNFIYLFDGLDEVSDTRIDTTLAYIFELAEKKSTKTIIISCRIASSNKIKLKMGNKDLDEYRITELSKEEIERYFSEKGDVRKQEKLHILAKTNPTIFSGIQDTLTLSIFWKQIDKINSDSYLTDLIEVHINETLNNISHTKYLNELNIPNPKKDTIIELNKQISLYNFEHQIVSIKYEELYSLLLDLLPRCDYYSINRIIDFLAENYFDIYGTNTVQSYTYKHRRYSEYFLMLSIIEKMEEDSRFLREKHLLTNIDFFYKMLIPYLKNEAIKTNNLVLSQSLELYGVYLGKNKNWGADEPYYKWSDYLTYALTSQNNDIFEVIINDDNLVFKDYFLELPNKIIEKLLRLTTKNQSKDTEIDYLLKIFLRSLVELYKQNKKGTVKLFLEKYEKIMQLLLNVKYRLYYTEEKAANEFWRNKFYIDIVIRQRGVVEYKEMVSEIKDDLSAEEFVEDYTPEILTVMKSLTYILTMERPNEFVSLLKDFNEYQLGSYLISICEPDCLASLQQFPVLKNEIFKRISSLNPSEGLHQALIYGFKKYAGEVLTDEETKCIEKYITKLGRIESSVFWKNHHNVIAFLSLPDKNNKSMEIKLHSSLMVYNKFYEMYVLLLDGTCSLAKIVKLFSTSTILKNSTVGYYVRLLLGYVFVLTGENLKTVKGCINYLNHKEIENMQMVYFQIKKADGERYRKLFSTDELLWLTSEESYKDIDYSSTSESMFIISCLLADFDENVSYQFLLSGVEHGIMRMNSRKDTLADEILIGSFEILLRNYWISKEQAYIYVDKLIDIALTLNNNHVDNKVFEMLIEVLIRNNFEIAFYCYEKSMRFVELDNKLHREVAYTMVDLGIPLTEVEKCIMNFNPYFDNYHQRTNWSYYYGKIEVYLAIGLSDFYSKKEHAKILEKIQQEIDALDYAGWDRELYSTEFQSYIKLCERFSKQVDVDEKKESDINPKATVSKSDNMTLTKIIRGLDSKEKLEQFFNYLDSKYCIDTLEQYECLVEKCVDIFGNINILINHLCVNRYPDMIYFKKNSEYLYLGIAAALDNANTKQQMVNYLINEGGGHDSYYELIKVYEVLEDKHMCVRLFESLLNDVNLLVY
ncbi:hypothetical protein QGM71_12290 [Virgibacillus sp. C22-A2]|uniref:NACHT domain-containing protein n=1 Tax=Virgibacillus tibetensis TaxID=3042313 RepID=A0ABU6KGQ7_9BACI|nr:hypothetical protein [Virgibacillus sp. C22-A2]